MHAAARQNFSDEQSQPRIDEAKRRRGPQGLAEFVHEYFYAGGQKRAPDKAQGKKGTSRRFDQASHGKQNDSVDRIRQMRQRRQHDRKRDRGHDGGRGRNR